MFCLGFEGGVEQGNDCLQANCTIYKQLRFWKIRYIFESSAKITEKQQVEPDLAQNTLAQVLQETKC